MDIPKDYPQLDELVANMFETLTASEGVGLAAPQIGLNIRVAVIDLDVLSEDLPEYKDFRKVYINPHILEFDDSETETMEEGCLSLPGTTSTRSGWTAIWHASCSMSSTIWMRICSSTGYHHCAVSSSRTS